MCTNVCVVTSLGCVAQNMFACFEDVIQMLCSSVMTWPDVAGNSTPAIDPHGETCWAVSTTASHNDRHRLQNMKYCKVSRPSDKYRCVDYVLSCNWFAQQSVLLWKPNKPAILAIPAQNTLHWSSNAHYDEDTSSTQRMTMPVEQLSWIAALWRIQWANAGFFQNHHRLTHFQD